MSVFTGGPYGRLAFLLNTLSSLNIEIIIIIIIIIIIEIRTYTGIIWNSRLQQCFVILLQFQQIL